jgi:AAA15 family ATPase/GTPase
MIIRSVRLINYKCFDDSGDITFGEKLNLIVGQNNSGKTTLFDSLDLQRFTNKAHRDLTQDPRDILDPISRLEMEISLSGKELYRILMQSGERGMGINLKSTDIYQAKLILEKLFELDTIRLSLKYNPKHGWENGNQGGESDFTSDNGAQIHFLPSADVGSWRLNGPTTGLTSFALS